MINLAGLVLVALSMAAAGVWSPPPDVRRPEDNLLVKEGHRVIVVEYEREGLRPPFELPKDASASVKRAIIDQSSGAQDAFTAERISRKPSEGFKEGLKEKLREAAEVLPKLGQGVSQPPVKETEPTSTEHHDSKICDAYGVCKEKISGAFGAAKDKVAGVRDKFSGKAAESKAAAVEGIKKVAREGEELVKRGQEVGKGAVDKAKEHAEKAAEVAKEAKDGASDAVFGGARRIVEEGSQKAGEAKYASGRAEEKVQEEKAKVKDASGRAGEKVQEAMYRAKNIVEDGRRNITEIVQRGKDVAYDAAMYAVSTESLLSLLSLLHSTAFSLVFGTCFWVTFVSSYVLLRALPRQQFGVVQSKIYPVYFRTMTYGIGTCFLTQFFAQRWASASIAGRLQAYNLLVSLGFVLANMLYLEPRATKVMYDRLKLEKEEGRGQDISDMDQRTEPATGTAAGGATVTAATTLGLEEEAVKVRLVEMNRKLKDLNGYSSLLNMMTLMGLAWHLVYVSQRQQISSC